MTILRREKYGLPLLQRELTELSARPRTFVNRSIYAVVFFGLIGWQFGEQVSQTDISAQRDIILDLTIVDDDIQDYLNIKTCLLYTTETAD